MRGKNVLKSKLTVLIFLSASVVGVTTVYRVSEVTVQAPVISSEAKTEAQALQNRLKDAYAQQSTFFVDEKLAQEIVADFPYFRITSFKRAYPNRLVVEVTEDAEVYGASFENGYYILNAEGTVLGVRENYANRTDGSPNILLFGTPSLTLVGEKGEMLSGDSSLSAVFAFSSKMNELFLVQETDGKARGIRGSVRSIEILRPVNTETEIMFKLTMTEGVCIYVRNPLSNTELKAEKAINAYLSLSDRQKLTGMLAVFDGETEIKTAYYEDLIF